MTAPYVDLNDDDYWQSLVDRGVTPDDAHLHVVRRRQRNTEQRLGFGEQERAEAQPDFSGLDGALLASALKLGQGASFGLTDELSGDPEAARMALDAAQEQQPGVSTVSDLAGGFVSPMPGAGIARNLVRKAPLVYRGLAGAGAGAATGGLAGALQGAGRGETPEGRELGAKVGGASGALLGLLLGGLSGRMSAKWQRTAESDRLRQMRLAEAEQGALKTKTPLEPGASPEDLAAKRLGLTPEQLKGQRSPEGQAIVDRMQGKTKTPPRTTSARQAPPTAKKITDDPVAKQIAGQSVEKTSSPPMNPRTGKPVTEREVAIEINKEKRAAKVLKDRPDQTVGPMRLAQRKDEMSARLAKNAEGLTDAQLKQELTKVAKRTDAAAPWYRSVLEEEAQRRGIP